MSGNRRIIASWSSGKDSAWMLHVLRQANNAEVVGLLTTFNAAVDRVAMHAVRRDLVMRQANAVGLPLHAVMLPWPCSDEEYAVRMQQFVTRAVAEGVTHVAFGDLFLEDIRDYRIQRLAGTKIEPLFPVWCGPRGTERLSQKMVAAGFRAIVTCVDPQQLPAAFVGRQYDAKFLADLPAGVDPCGEHGEFHTFCYAGPHQRVPLAVRVGQRIERDGYVFADVMSQADATQN
jgi:uncharacterized protein (TIGR00290 family)